MSAGPPDGVRSLSGEIVGGAEDGSRFHGLKLRAAPLAVLLVTRQGQPMAMSPVGLSDADLVDLLDRALDQVRTGLKP